MKRGFSRALIVMALLGLTAVAARAQTSDGSAPPSVDPDRRIVICTEQYEPVCGRIGEQTQTYSNACFARGAGAEVIALGACSDKPGANPDGGR